MLPFALLVSMCSLSNSMTMRGGIPVYTVEEMLSLKARDPSNYQNDFLYSPFILTQTPSSKWTIYENLYDIFDEYDNGFEINAKRRETDCSCFESQEVCKEFVSTFLYEKTENTNYKFWEKHELSYAQYQKYAECMTQTKSSFSVQQMSDLLYNINSQTFLNKSNADILSKEYTYFKLVNLNKNPSKISMTTLNVLDQMSMKPFFDVLSMDSGYNMVNEVHIWFGTEYYRAVRHYDKGDNLFFVLYGSRRFRLSPPTAAYYDLHPFKHKSGRQQYPHYPVLDSQSQSDDSSVSDPANQPKTECNIIGSPGIQTTNCEKRMQSTAVRDTNGYDNDGLIGKPEQYPMMEADILENEALYLPGFWYHEVVNDNFSCALNVWFDTPHFGKMNRIQDMHLVLNPAKGIMKMDEVDEFFYFAQVLTSKWCGMVASGELWSDSRIRTKNSENAYTKCDAQADDGFLFMSKHFENVYPVLKDLNYDNFEWMALGMNAHDLLRCVNDRVGYIYYNGDMNKWKKDNFVCYELQDKYQQKWDKFIDKLIDEHLKFGDIGIIEAQLVEYIESTLYDVAFGTNILPFWISVMKL